MSSSLRPNRNAARTTLTGRRPAVFSDTNVPRNRGPTNWPCRQEFCRSHLNEVAMLGKTNAFRATGNVFRFAESYVPSILIARGGAAW